MTTEIDEFCKYLQFEKRLSPHTITAYQNDLMQFTSFLNRNIDNSGLESIDYKSIRQWIVNLMANDISSRSINRKLTALKTFFKFLIKEGKLVKSPMDKVIAPKSKKRLPSFVEENQLNQLIDEDDSAKGQNHQRDIAIVETFYNTGIRVSELINIKESDIDFSYNQFKIIGKRNKERTIPFDNQFAEMLKKFIEEKNSNALNNTNSFLFVSSRGNKLNRMGIYRIIKNFLLLASTSDKKSPHVLRHSFATHMLNNGADLNAIKELLGHANLAATQVYTHNTFEKLTKVYKQAHPRA